MVYSIIRNLKNTPVVINERRQKLWTCLTRGMKTYEFWWERNAMSNEPMLRVSNYNGKTFGDTIKLSAK